jgi:hypothetical protein
MFEHRSQPLLPRIAFILRFARSLALTFGIVLFAWGVGTLGYHGLEGLSWIDALLNAAMILAGMGPVSELHTTGGKLFACCYALSSGFLFLTIAGILLVPVLHRLMHRFHLDAAAGQATLKQGRSKAAQPADRL